MTRRKNKTPCQAKLIAFKVLSEADRDILAWWHGIPEGERSEALRTVIRTYLGNSKVKEQAPSFYPISQVADDTAWIRTALLDLPGYLERLVEQTAAIRPVVVASAAMSEPEVPRLEDEAVQRRRDKMSQNKW